jgi:hypothetical protein
MDKRIQESNPPLCRYRRLTVYVPDLPNVVRFIDSGERLVYINIAATPEANIDRLINRTIS